MSDVLEPALAPIRAALRRLAVRLDAKPTLRQGTVTSVGPVRVQLDGDTSPTPLTPRLLTSVSPGDRVTVAYTGRDLTILGVIGGGVTPWESLAVSTGNTWVDEPGRYIEVRKLSPSLVEFRCELRRSETTASGLSFTLIPIEYRPARDVFEFTGNTNYHQIMMWVESGGLARAHWAGDPGTSVIRWHTTWGI